jgi:hypothetical protein
MAATPNAGGSSGLSEIFAYEQLARCEGAVFLKSETEIVYAPPTSKKTDLEVMLGTHKLGVSVTRACTRTSSSSSSYARPRVSSSSTSRVTLSSSDSSCVWMVSAGSSGTSYGSLIPVKWSILPASAFL